MEKIYCFVDETGQDTAGRLFLVVVVLKEKSNIEELEKQLLNLEVRTGKRLFKWGKTSHDTRVNYFSAIKNIAVLKKAIFYSIYTQTKEYTVLTALTIAKSVLAQGGKGEVKIIIDGLNAKEMEKVRRELKSLKIKYQKIRGMKDEQSVFLRLADAAAGLLRDSYEKQDYAKFLVEKLKTKGILAEV